MKIPVLVRFIAFSFVVAVFGVVGLVMVSPSVASVKMAVPQEDVFNTWDREMSRVDTSIESFLKETDGNSNDYLREAVKNQTNKFHSIDDLRKVDEVLSFIESARSVTMKEQETPLEVKSPVVTVVEDDNIEETPYEEPQSDLDIVSPVASTDSIPVEVSAPPQQGGKYIYSSGYCDTFEDPWCPQRMVDTNEVGYVNYTYFNRYSVTGHWNSTLANLEVGDVITVEGNGAGTYMIDSIMFVEKRTGNKITEVPQGFFFQTCVGGSLMKLAYAHQI